MFRSSQWVMFLRCRVFLFSICALGAFGIPQAVAQAVAPWPPISKEDLELKDNAAHPGDSAIILYREVLTDNSRNLETHFTRIKILTDRGKKYADVEIPYVEDKLEVQDIRARIVAPDGQASEFAGTVYDRVEFKTRRFRLNVKTFSLPNVQAGSILDYSYTLHVHRDIPDVIKHPERYLFSGGLAYPAAEWSVQRELYVRKAHYALHPFAAGARVEIRAVHLPKVAPPVKQPDGTILLDVENIPGMREEDYSPPEEIMHGEVYIFYVVGFFSNETFWSDIAQARFAQTEKFLGHSKLVQQEVARLISPGDRDETKLRKLYERVQQIRMVSFEPAKTEKERERENLKTNKSAEDVLSRGYAFANEINLLFVAMARAAGFKAFIVLVASRNRRFFLKSLPDPEQLDAEIVEVSLGDRTLFLDPATLHCPFGSLPWEETDTQGVRIDRVSLDISVPRPRSEDAIIERTASFHLDKDGNLEGKLEISFLGQEALVRRIDENNKDDAARKKDLEDEARTWLPKDAIVKLISSTGWAASDGPLRASFAVQSPGFAVPAGHRLLVPVVVLWQRSGNMFLTSNRENPVYLKYGHQENDEMAIDIPQSYTLESLPLPKSMKTSFASYSRSAEQSGSQLKLKRSFVMETYSFTREQYPALHQFYSFAKTNDEEHAVLQSLPTN